MPQFLLHFNKSKLDISTINSICIYLSGKNLTHIHLYSSFSSDTNWHFSYSPLQVFWHTHIYGEIAGKFGPSQAEKVLLKVTG